MSDNEEYDPEIEGDDVGDDETYENIGEGEDENADDLGDIENEEQDQEEDDEEEEEEEELNKPYDDDDVDDDDNEDEDEDDDVDNGTKSDDDYDDDDDTNFEKFDDEVRNNYVQSIHPELSFRSNDEIEALSQVTRDGTTGRIIKDERHMTIPILSKFEFTRIIGSRISQLAQGAKPLVEIKKKA